jgi:hypothetical protein
VLSPGKRWDNWANSLAGCSTGAFRSVSVIHHLLTG